MRCFLAIELNEETTDKLAAATTELRELGIDAAFPKEFHITLCFFGEITEQQAADKIQKLQDLQVPTFPLKITGVGFFPNENFVRTIWAGGSDGSAQLIQLQKTVAEKLAYKNDFRFTPHATLARVKTPRNKEKLKPWAEQNKNREFGTTTIDKIAFKKSTLTPEGPQYETLAEIPLK